MMKGNLRCFVLLLGLLLASITAFGQGTAFTYQGKLNDNGAPASGQYDFQFKLFDTATVGTGTQQGAMVPASNITVTAGLFTVQLDFGACASCFNGQGRFLEIAVKPTSGSMFTTLSPRQPITPTPYAIKSQNAAAADGLSVACVNCVTSSQIASVSGSVVSGAIPVASVPAGSANYIQNTTNLQATSNFNISGNGTAGGTLSAGVMSATTQFDLGSINGTQRVLSAPGGTNLFVGFGAGTNNAGGGGNTFFGHAAGQQNTSGGGNSFFGRTVGLNNISGSSNSFFGVEAGDSNTTGSLNTFIGEDTGDRNTTGSNNTFIGAEANFTVENLTSSDNNTLLGSLTRVSSGINNGTAIGFRALVAQSDSLVLGGITGFNSGTDTRVGIGTTSPGAVLDVQRDQNTIPETARFTTFGSANEILSRSAGGTRAIPTATPSGQILLQLGATGHDGSGFATFSKASIQAIAAETWTPTAQGTRIRFNTTLSGTTASTIRMTINDDGNVGIGTTTPDDKLDVNGIIRVTSLGSGNTISLCRNSSFQISNCSSSLRYKTHVATLHSGLSLIKRLRPVTFTWKADRAPDLGLIAEEVAKVEPLLTFRNSKGEIEGVKYDRLSVALVNAVKEQQTQIEQQQAQIKTQRTIIQRQQTIAQRQETQLAQQRAAIARQQTEIDDLKRLICAEHRRATLCKRRR
jgi:hypothetical protein